MTINEGLASLAVRAKLAQWLVAAAAALLALTVLVQLAYTMFMTSATPTITLVLTSLGVLALLRVLLVLAAVIAVPLWVYRAWANLQLIGLSGLRHSPTWAALSFFVPIANLFVPFLAMRELYNRSLGENEDHADESAADVTSWWACYIGGGCVSTFTALVPLLALLTGGALMITAPIFIQLLMALFGTTLIIAAAWFLWRVIGAITAAQRSFAGIAETFA
ncbi:hypothetical protein SZ64_02040 [Erythrobacter sp. SG61-1L]|uniref:DUF4328 domain-containing protein n=1 Tax=Erythrobacter sp. SG61-1L TaxID=1603897 RepID=UPI0006C9082F|nr:DUF4328 domain-containing protein [Erythrobacter sp. SG61-1L]KPL66979.1 hypothetical protein SZ64_02040 [Erythrobacter sp. SG61-1L]